MAGDLLGDRKVLALSFDDGPGEVTADVLNQLAAHRARATFFLLGREAERRPDIVCRAVREGHELGNHTFSHPRLRTLTLGSIEDELRSTSELIEQISGALPRLFRPPYGLDGLDALPIAKQLGMTTVRWTLNPKDRQQERPEDTAGAVIAGARHGAVVLLHDGGDDRRPLVKVLELLLPKLKDQGFELVTVSELLEQSRRARRLTVVRRRSALRKALGAARLRIVGPGQGTALA